MFHGVAYVLEALYVFFAFIWVCAGDYVFVEGEDGAEGVEEDEAEAAHQYD